jgi:hypothetical protein
LPWDEVDGVTMNSFEWLELFLRRLTKEGVTSFFCYQHAAPPGLENKEHYLKCRGHGILADHSITRTPLFSFFYAWRINNGIFAAPSRVCFFTEMKAPVALFLSSTQNNDLILRYGVEQK